MNKKLEKSVSGQRRLASLVHKKVTGLVKELQGEGALTGAEGKKVLKGLNKVKKALYDDVSGELKKVLNKKTSAKKKSSKKRK